MAEMKLVNAEQLDADFTAIADAIREKNGSSDTYSPGDMAAAIGAIETGGGAELPEEAYTITGNCAYRFAQGGWNWYIEAFGNKLKTKDITNCGYMFMYAGALEEIPFDINLANSNISASFFEMFYYCSNLKSVPLIKGTIKAPTSSYSGNPNISSMFDSCYRVKEIPYNYFSNFGGAEFWAAVQQYTGSRSSMFKDCYSIRQLPDVSMLLNKETSTYSNFYANAFSKCYSLDEIIDLPVNNLRDYTSNLFNCTFDYCGRVKNITFALQEDGTPYKASWKSQTLALESVGTTNYVDSATNYNSGITADKYVKDDATYQALKDNPDWFSNLTTYSRYNHDSAVNTINSLPDTSEYLATAGGTNTIRFFGNGGRLTDGGAINTLTEEEIAIAAAKGWTISFT